MYLLSMPLGIQLGLGGPQIGWSKSPSLSCSPNASCRSPSHVPGWGRQDLVLPVQCKGCIPAGLWDFSNSSFSQVYTAVQFKPKVVTKLPMSFKRNMSFPVWYDWGRILWGVQTEVAIRNEQIPICACYLANPYVTTPDLKQKNDIALLLNFSYKDEKVHA